MSSSVEQWVEEVARSTQRSQVRWRDGRETETKSFVPDVLGTASHESTDEWLVDSTPSGWNPVFPVFEMKPKLPQGVGRMRNSSQGMYNGREPPDDASASGDASDAFFGAVMRILRLRRKKKLDEVAAAAGISVSYLSLIERGERSPPPDTQAALAKALDVSPTDLLDMPRDLLRVVDQLVGRISHDDVVDVDVRMARLERAILQITGDQSPGS